MKITLVITSGALSIRGAIALINCQLEVKALHFKFEFEARAEAETKSEFRLLPTPLSRDIRF
jgi:hypothetical protein